YFAALGGLSTLAGLIPGLPRAPFWVGLPLAALLVGGSGWVLVQLVGEDQSALALIALAPLLTALVKAWQPRWGWMAALIFATVTLGTLAYLTYAAALTFTTGLGWAGTLASAVLLLFELAALTLAVTYLFEILDRLGARPLEPPVPDPEHLPRIALQVPAYNEPVEIVSETLHTLAKLDYPRLLVQVVDNNTPDPEVWKPLEKLCQDLGERFE